MDVVIICTLQMRKVRRTRLSNVPEATHLGSGAGEPGFELKQSGSTGCGKQGPRSKRWELGSSSFIQISPFSLHGGFLAKPPPECAVSLGRTQVRAARVGEGAARLSVAGCAC